MKPLLRSLIIIFFLLSGLVSSSWAQHFYLDSTFQYNGIDTFGGYIPTGVIHRPEFAVHQLDNKILLAGYSLNSSTVELMRLKMDGSFDSTFSDTGVVRVTEPYTQVVPTSVAVYDTSKIVMISQWLNVSANNEFIQVYNFNSNGTLNTGFGVGGIKEVQLATYATPITCGVQTDGKIMVMGLTVALGTGYYIYGIARLLPNGNLDPSYGNNGIELCPHQMLDTPVNSNTPIAGYPSCGLLQPDNKFVVAGFFSDSLATYAGYHAFVVRHNMDGSPDYTFAASTGGVSITKDTNAFFMPKYINTDAAGNYYVFCTYQQSHPPWGDTNFVVIKLDHNGNRVTNYGINGIAYLPLQILNGGSALCAVQPDGKVVIPGVFRTYTPDFEDWALVYRLDSVGHLDTSFNTAGQMLLQRPGHYHDLFTNAGIQRDGKILLIGYDSTQATSVCMRLTNGVDVTPTSVKALPAFTQSLTTYVYPNPAVHKSFKVHYKNTSLSTHCKVYVYDIYGKMIDMHSEFLLTGEGDMEYQLPETARAGVYNIVVHCDTGEEQTHKVATF
ncbi:MAG: T9SS type A sorting domain-containing protein [Bacteroidota bacterium]